MKGSAVTQKKRVMTEMGVGLNKCGFTPCDILAFWVPPVFSFHPIWQKKEISVEKKTRTTKEKVDKQYSRVFAKTYARLGFIQGSRLLLTLWKVNAQKGQNVIRGKTAIVQNCRDGLVAAVEDGSHFDGLIGCEVFCVDQGSRRCGTWKWSFCDCKRKCRWAR